MGHIRVKIDSSHSTALMNCDSGLHYIKYQEMRGTCYCRVLEKLPKAMILGFIVGVGGFFPPTPTIKPSIIA